MSLLAGFTEEPLKFATVVWKTRRNRELDEPLDGMIYGATVGLGFAAAETVLYIVRALVGDIAEQNLLLGIDPFTGAFVGTAPLRALTSALMHAFCSGLAGYYFAKMVPRGSYTHARRLGPLAGVAAAHGLYNGSASVHLLLAIAILGGIGVLFFLTLRTALCLASPAPADRNPGPNRVHRWRTPPVPRQPCPVCAESIAIAAKRCRFCGCRRISGDRDSEAALDRRPEVTPCLLRHYRISPNRADSRSISRGCSCPSRRVLKAAPLAADI